MGVEAIVAGAVVEPGGQRPVSEHAVPGRPLGVQQAVHVRQWERLRGRGGAGCQQGYCVVGLLLVTASTRSCGRWLARLVARAMLVSPLLRWKPIEVFRSAAKTAGPLPVRA